MDENEADGQTQQEQEQDEGAGVFYGVVDPTHNSAGPSAALSAGLEVHALGARLHCSCGSAVPVGPSDLGQHLRCSGCARIWVVRLLLGTVQHAEVVSPATRERPT